MNSYSDACMTIVADNIEKIYGYLEKNLQNEMVCQPLGFCDEIQLKVCILLKMCILHMVRNVIFFISSRFVFPFVHFPMTESSNPNSPKVFRQWLVLTRISSANSARHLCKTSAISSLPTRLNRNLFKF